MFRRGAEFTPLSVIANTEQYSTRHPLKTVVFDLSKMPKDFRAEELEVDLGGVFSLMQAGQVGDAHFGGIKGTVPHVKTGVLLPLFKEVQEPPPEYFAGRWLGAHIPIGTTLHGGETAEKAARVLDREVRHSLMRIGRDHLIDGGKLPDEWNSHKDASISSAAAGIIASLFHQKLLVDVTAIPATYTAIGALDNYLRRKIHQLQYGEGAGFRDTVFPLPHVPRAAALELRTMTSKIVRARSANKSN